MYRRIIILTALICSLAASAHAAQISVEPAYQEAFKGDTITVNITVYPEGSSVYAASYTLYFNKTLLNATSQTQGPFLSQDGESTNVFVNEINNTLGRIEYAESRMGTLVGVNGSGVLATITFHVIGEEGVSMLNISDLDGELLYSTAGPIQTDINNGTCRIEEDTCQPPTSTYTPPTTTSAQTLTTIPTAPTPTATTIQNPPIHSAPSPSPTITTSPVPTALTPSSEEKSEENNGLPGFKTVFVITVLIVVLVLKRKSMKK